MQGRIIFSLILVFFGISTVKAGSFEFPTTRADALGGTVVLSTPTPSEQLLSGAPLAQTEKIAVDFGYKRKYELKDLDLVYSAVSYRIQNYSFTAGFSQLGNKDLYTVKQYRLAFLYTKSIFTIGNFVTGESHDFNSRYNSLNQISYSLSLHLHYKNIIVSFLLDNINRPSLTEASQKSERKFTLFAELAGNKYYKTTFKFSTEKGKENKFGIGESVKISQVGTLLFGFSTAPIEFGAGVELKWNNQRLIYNSSYHPVLGLTHSVSFLIKLIHN